MEEIHKIQINGKTLIIYQDDCDDPRHWDNLTKMVCFHKRYTLGDKHDYLEKDYSGWDELEEAIRKREHPVVIRPLYLYDHSGITISTKDFNDRFDSGQIGFIYITNKEIDELGVTINDDESWTDYLVRLEEQLEGEVEIYDQYLTGDVYGFSLENENDDSSDSCGGFFGTDWMNNGMADHINDEEILEALKKL